MSLLTNPFAIGATLSLAIQYIILLLLIRGYMLKKQFKFRQHGLTMATAVFLHLIVIFSLMVPAFGAILPQFVIPKVTGLVSVASLIHVAAGATAASLGVWLVVSWRFGNVQSCFKRKRFMLWTLTIWSAAITFGTVLYFILYWSTLTG